mgnify:FL=1|tara:strand:- start:8664 stop:9704 length:1041 start_codon:yes stop_codon:yes gene_type:complete
MSSAHPIASGIDPVWRRYRDNFPRHVLGVTRYLESGVMEQLAGVHGFVNLRLYYEPYITLAADEGIRLTELAEALNISRQAANQAANQIEAAGYVLRVPDPQDGRAKRVILTKHGRKLRTCGLQVAATLQRECGQIVGQKALRQIVTTLTELCAATGTSAARISGPAMDEAPLIALLPRLANFISLRLMASNIRRGHVGLKMSYGQVLTLIGPEGGRILRIAALQDVSKQAVSAMVSELEQLGYIYRDRDPEDARQVLLRFTGLGRKLIEDSVEGMDELEMELGSIVGQAALEELRSGVENLYKALQPDVAVFTDAALNVKQLARELKGKLSPEARLHLAKLLLEQ